MKNEITKKVLLFSIGIFVFVHLNAQKHDAMVQQLLQQNNWFVLDKEYPQIKDSIKAPELKWLTESILNLKFNESNAAISSIDTLLYKYQQDIGLSNSLELFRYKISLLVEKGEYGLAADELQDLLEQLTPHLSQEELKEFEEPYNLYNFLRNEARPTIIRPDKDVEIPYGIMDINFIIQNRDTLKETTTQLGIVKLSIQGKEGLFLLDTGCEKTCIFDNFSKKIDLHYVKDSVLILGTGITNGKLAILDSVSLGEVTFYNSLVATADNFLTYSGLFVNEELNDVVQGILGIDFIKRIGEIEIYPQNRKIVIPSKDSELPYTGKNIMLDNRNYIILKTFNDKEELITFHIDSGNSNSCMFKSYYLKNKKDIENKLEKQLFNSLGVGSLKQNTSYLLPSLEFVIGDTNCYLNNISVFIDNVFTEDINADGSLGFDFINKFSKITLNLNKMFVQVEK